MTWKRMLLVTGLCCAASMAQAAPRATGWITSWDSAQQVPEPNNALAPGALADATLRQVVHLSAGGPAVRVRFSNLFGTTPLTITAAHVALGTPGGAAIRAGSDHHLTFSGRTSVTIPAGAELASDRVAMPLPAGTDLAVSVHFAAAPGVQTSHPGSRATSYVAPGDQTAAPDLTGATAFKHWFQLTAVEVQGNGPVIATIGDSITDGHAAGDDRNERWPDRLAERLRAAGLNGWGVANTGIGGNRVLADGLGPRLVERFDRDTVDRPGVRYAIVLEGVNDLGVMTRDHPVAPEVHRKMVADIEAAYRDLARRAHARGVKLFGGTITPFAGSAYYHPGPETEADRQAINAFVRTSGTFDGVVDFDAALRDPAHPDRLLAAYDSGDGLHPGPAGYEAMAAAVPLALFGVKEPATRRPVIALTFDDIPAHGPLPPGETRLQVAHQVIAALKAQHAPVFGFVNGGFGAGDPDAPRVLAAWRAAGFPFGNHTFSHPSLNKSSAEAFEAEIVHNEATIAPLMAGQDWHWLRYPFLDEGDTPAKRDAVRGWLGAHGYKVAAVTMSFGDYNWNEPYARCMATGDNAAIARLERSYLDAARAEAQYERATAKAALGHDVPYVLLMHLGAFDARMLPRLLALYRSLGFGFTTLQAAEADPFYAGALNLSLPGPSPTLQATAAAKGIRMAARPQGFDPSTACR